MSKRHTILLGCLLASASASADIQLPHALSPSLTTEQVNENIAYLTETANTALADIEALQSVTTTQVLQRMSAGQGEITLVTQGEISVKASCEFNNLSEASEGISLKVWTEAENEGALLAAESYGYYGGSDNLQAIWFDEETDNHTDYIFSNYIDQGVTVSASGDVVMMDGESFGYGINVQGSDCLITGQISSFTDIAAPESFDPSNIVSSPEL